MSEDQMAAYKKKLKARAKKGGWSSRLFGQFK